MPTYTYSCTECGTFDLVRLMDQRADPALCPQCGSQGRRAFSSPHLSRVDPAVEAAVATAGASAESPGVTRRIPPAATSRPDRARSGPALPRP